MLEIGCQCSQPLCTDIDFLPIFCRCQRYFCRVHSVADVHGCTYARPTATVPIAGPSAPLQRCAVDKCTKPSLEAFIASGAEGRTPANCPQCNAAFCAEHRHPKSHSCQTMPVVAPKNEAARALLAKNFPSRTKAAPLRRTTKTAPTDPVKLAQFRKLELMNMRHRAVPVDPKDKSAAVPQDDRLYIKVFDDNNEKVFWVRKSLGTGRVLDLLATQLKMSSDTTPLQLLKVAGEDRILCRNDHVFSNEVEDGSTVVVSHCP
ncbi:hypothetical protein C8R47DRAFT_1114331 [Mycena vitilis]|nr:hypothetical protein C8R47DRAFT_1114331 [Mycena vitilis]